MSLFLRVAAFFLNIIAMVINTVVNLLVPRRKPSYAPITNPILKKSVIELRELMTEKKVVFVLGFEFDSKFSKIFPHFLNTTVNLTRTGKSLY